MPLNKQQSRMNIICNFDCLYKFRFQPLSQFGYGVVCLWGSKGTVEFPEVFCHETSKRVPGVHLFVQHTDTPWEPLHTQHRNQLNKIQ